ncbi:hypothetical protein SUGI_1132730 [Cryptomeria japonica]|uniref:GATA transcription factor 9 n=1 Tax=Cryptomeria japonica TaxID=3369 RepID=UPI0024147A5F|nr:GATA transcription factor 9 [Cryptomeria japonica]XP_057819485.1 GATA transcription factor 9 [Cryptomeria japonica]XP_059069942.1 GATA transcription factor 9 [Cryptomeria japonica]GLJ53153.1 hypothetical protein SUGI_1132730 [Cryptomeria japonica]
MEATDMYIGSGYGTSLVGGMKSGVMTKLEASLQGDLFDHIDDLLDFSNEEIGGPIGENSINFPKCDIFCESSKTEAESCNLTVDGADESNPADLCVPCDDLAELEWLSNFVEDSFLENGPKPLFCPDFGVGLEKKHGEEQSSDKFRSSSPISVLESSSCSGKNSTLISEITVPGKARSKRSRVPVCNWASRILSPASSDIVLESGPNSSLSANAAVSSDSDYLVSEQAESYPSKKFIMATQGNKKKVQDPINVRKCMHCGIQKTPQWRAGPMGPKTLCNACGVRYKSGRLLPEYRPAASPTFSVEKHSNSHKKVLEMRRQKDSIKQPTSQAKQTYFGSEDDYLVHIEENYRLLI